jgi:glycosidase
MRSFLHFPDTSFHFLLLLIPLIGVFILLSCTSKKKEVIKPKSPESFVVHPEWSKNANIYEVNIRQYTPEGTFKAFQEHLPRLRELGVDILWLMPVNPIGEKNRKGSLGSYYAIQDYKAINPEFGTMEDFKELVSKAHELGFKIILDWVANHTAWDNLWITEHPEWYTSDSLGKLVSPFDWTDVADLNYDNKDLWTEMISALMFWITEADVDGYRCDVAGKVPTEFWERARTELDKIKPVFMLAEAEQPDHHIRAFDMSYAWELHHVYNSIAKGEKNANDLMTYFIKQDTLYPADAFRMNFITNHDENSWKGTEFARMGEATNTMAVLTYTLPGMPLLYSGQEAGMNKMLRFFDKDTIDWNFSSPLAEFYKKLNQLKRNNASLWNGLSGGILQRIKTNNDSTVFAFVREKEEDKIFVITNLSARPITVKFSGNQFNGDYFELFSGEEKNFGRKTSVELKPWQYFVFVKKSDNGL